MQDTFITIQAEQPRVEAATKARRRPRTRPCAGPAPVPTLFLTLALSLAPLLDPALASPSPYAHSLRPAPTQVRVLSFESTAKLLCRLEAESAVRPTLTLHSPTFTTLTLHSHPHPTLPPSP